MTFLKGFAAVIFLSAPAMANDGCAAVSPQLGEAGKALANGAPDSAEQILQPLRTLAPACAEALLLLGKARSAQGMPVLAMNLLAEYVQRVPSDPAGQLALSTVLLRQADYAGAENALAAALRLEPGNLEGLLLQARLFGAEHRQTDAERVLLNACRTHPDSAEARFQLGLLFDAQRRSSEAEKTFAEVVRLDPANSSAWDYLALSLESMGKETSAEAAYLSGLKVNGAPRLDRFLGYNYGRFLMKENRLKESKTWFNRAAALSPDMRAVFYERAKLYLVLSEYPAARADAEHALRIPDPGQFIQAVQVYALLSNICEHLGDAQAAGNYAALARATKLNTGAGGRR